MLSSSIEVDNDYNGENEHNEEERTTQFVHQKGEPHIPQRFHGLSQHRSLAQDWRALPFLQFEDLYPFYGKFPRNIAAELRLPNQHRHAIVETMEGLTEEKTAKVLHLIRSLKPGQPFFATDNDFYNYRRAHLKLLRLKHMAFAVKGPKTKGTSQISVGYHCPLDIIAHHWIEDFQNAAGSHSVWDWALEVPPNGSPIQETVHSAINLQSILHFQTKAHSILQANPGITVFLAQRYFILNTYM